MRSTARRPCPSPVPPISMGNSYVMSKEGRPDLVDVYAIEGHDGRVPHVDPLAERVGRDGRGAVAHAVEPSKAVPGRSG